MPPRGYGVVMWVAPSDHLTSLPVKFQGTSFVMMEYTGGLEVKRSNGEFHSAFFFFFFSSHLGLRSKHTISEIYRKASMDAASSYCQMTLQVDVIVNLILFFCPTFNSLLECVNICETKVGSWNSSAFKKEVQVYYGIVLLV